MSGDEKRILKFLRERPNLFISAKEIAKKASGRDRFLAEPEWARTVLIRLLQKELVELDQSGHYRIYLTSEERDKLDMNAYRLKCLSKMRAWN